MQNWVDELPQPAPGQKKKLTDSLNKCTVFLVKTMTLSERFRCDPNEHFHSSAEMAVRLDKKASFCDWLAYCENIELQGIGRPTKKALQG